MINIEKKKKKKKKKKKNFFFFFNLILPYLLCYIYLC